MKKYKVIINFLFSILFLNLYLINVYSINLSIVGSLSENSNIYSESITVNLSCNEDIQIHFPKKSFNRVYLNNNKVISINNDSYKLVDCNNINILKYNLNSIEKIDNKIRVERNFNNFNNLNYTYSIKIPSEYNLDINNSNPSKFKLMYKNNSKYYTFNNSNLYLLYFNLNNYEKKNFTIYSIIKELSELEVLLLILISFLIGFLCAYLFMKKKLTNLPKNSLPSYIFSKEDKLVIDEIKINIGINQKQIANNLNFSKSRVSAIVSNLESKKVIRREKFGRSYKVYMEKNII